MSLLWDEYLGIQNGYTLIFRLAPAKTTTLCFISLEMSNIINNKKLTQKDSVCFSWTYYVGSKLERKQTSLRKLNPRRAILFSRSWFLRDIKYFTWPPYDNFWSRRMMLANKWIDHMSICAQRWLDWLGKIQILC